MALKICNLCQEEKPIDSFSVHKKGAQGRHPVCKACRSQQAKLWYTEKRSESFKAGVNGANKLAQIAGTAMA
jgi:hypothetical protein